MSLAWTQQATLACLFSVSAAYCPPCNRGASLLQAVPPWKNFIPPASDAPVTPCGCGVDRTTPRDKIQEMAPATLRKKIGALEDEVDRLTDQLEKMQTDNTDELGKLKDRLKKKKEAEQDQKKDVDEAADKRTKERLDKKAEIDSMQDDVAGLAKDLIAHRETLKELQGELSMRVMEMETCGCNKGSLLSLKFDSVAPDHDLVFKFEKLEREKNGLSEQIDEEMAAFGSEQRNLLHRIDLEKGKMGRREARDAKYKNADKGSMKSVEQQYKAMKALRDAKQAQLDRVEKDVEKAQENYDKLEKEMGKCGCGPAGL